MPALRASRGKQGADVGRLHRSPLERTEHGRAAVDADSGPAVQPELHDGPRPGVQADNAVAVAFAVENAERAGLGVQVFRQQRQRFADAQARRGTSTTIKRAVSDARGRPASSRRESGPSPRRRVSGSGGSLRPLLAGTWSMMVEIMVAVLKVVLSCAST